MQLINIKIDLLKIVKPFWYFWHNSNKQIYWINYTLLTAEEQKKLDIDNNYENKVLKMFDASYQALQKGYINTDINKSLKIQKPITPSLNDQFRFIRRMFKPFWVYYILFVKIISFKVVMEDICAIIRTRRVKKITLDKILKEKIGDA